MDELQLWMFALMEKYMLSKKVRKTYFNVNSDMFQVAKMDNEKVGEAQ